MSNEDSIWIKMFGREYDNTSNHTIEK
jgi:hypothetical protein